MDLISVEKSPIEAYILVDQIVVMVQRVLNSFINFLYKFLYKRIVIVDQIDKRAKNKDIDGCRRPGLLPATTSSKIVNAYTKNISTMSFHVIHGMSRLKKQFKYYRKCSPRFITAQIEENQPEVPHHTTEG